MAITPTTRPCGGFWSRLLITNARLVARELRRLADQIEVAAPGPPVAAIIMFTKPDGGLTVSDIQVPDDSGPLTATAHYLDAKGNATTPASTPTWTSSDTSVATVSASDDGLTATVTLTGALGATQITASDAEDPTDPGDDVVSVGTVSVVPGAAVVGDISFTTQA